MVLTRWKTTAFLATVVLLSFVGAADDDRAADSGVLVATDSASESPADNATEPSMLVVSATVWETKTLSCPDLESDGSGQQPHFLWVTPKNELLALPSTSADSSNETNTSSADVLWDSRCVPPEVRITTATDADDAHFDLTPNGSLVIRDFGWGDRGRYRCLVHDPDTDEDDVEDDDGTLLLLRARSVEVKLDVEYREHIYYFSLMYGGVTAAGLLLLTLLCKLVYYLLETYGCCLCCCCCENQLPPKARKIKVALDSIEAYKAQQLIKLKDNYTQQSEWIRDNCAVQMERVRENYSSQVQNIRDIKQYGTSQIHAVREQYFEQMNRIRDYSSGQLDRVHENYIFQRQRLRKFSAQNYLRMRATGKYTQRTLNRVMENLPPLYLDLSNCRQGMGGRQESIHFPADFQIGDLGELPPLDPATFDVDIGRSIVLKRGRRGASEEDGGSSLYFTPEGTPLREMAARASADGDGELSAARKSSSLKNTPTREAGATTTTGQSSYYKSHKKSKSLTSFLPQKWLFINSEGSGAGGGGGGGGAAGGGQQRTVRAIIEHVASAATGGSVDGSTDFLDEGANIQPVDVRDKAEASSSSSSSGGGGAAESDTVTTKANSTSTSSSCQDPSPPSSSSSPPYRDCPRVDPSDDSAAPLAKDEAELSDEEEDADAGEADTLIVVVEESPSAAAKQRTDPPVETDFLLEDDRRREDDAEDDDEAGRARGDSLV